MRGFSVINMQNCFIYFYSADIGGLLGLFMGCSLLSIIELIYFAINAIINRKKRAIKTHKLKFVTVR